MTRVAAIDCGTNSLRLLVADIEGDTLVDVVREMEIVRLGEGVDDTGRLVPAAIERTRLALLAYAATIRDLDAVRTRMVATSASRDAENADEFTEMVLATLGIQPEVITGDEEAALSFAGATRGLSHDVGKPYLVVDIGGGSTEFVLGDATVYAARSVDVGCVRMTERHLHSDPPTAVEIAAARADISAAIATVAGVVPLETAGSLIGVAGSVTTVAAVALGLPAYDPVRIHGSLLTADEVRVTADQLLAMTRAERAALPVIHPGRVDIIGAGALVLRSIVDALGVAQVVVSEHDILDGIAWSIAEGRSQRGSA